MSAFFRGWRRKAGCLVLLFAAGFITTWLRSFVFQNDAINLDATHLLFSQNGDIVWNRTVPNDSLVQILQLPMKSDNGGLNIVINSKAPVLQWKRQFCGFVGMEVLIRGNRITQYRVPYWALTSPLLPLSAWLLLRKPVQQHQTAGTDPDHS